MSKIKLTNEQIADLQKHQRGLNDILPEFDQAEQCGVDCAEFRRIQADASSQIDKLLQYYGPQR